MKKLLILTAIFISSLYAISQVRPIATTGRLRIQYGHLQVKIGSSWLAISDSLSTIDTTRFLGIDSAGIVDNSIPYWNVSTQKIKFRLITLSGNWPLSGGGDLSANRSFSIDTSWNGLMTEKDLKRKIDSLAVLIAGGPSGMTIGVSTVSSGVSGRPLYDNGGVLGEMTVTGTGTVAVLATSPTLITPTLGVAVATSINGNIFTTGTYTITGGAGKTFTFNNSMTFTGTDATTMTFPTTSATLARTDAANTFTGTQSFGLVVASPFQSNSAASSSNFYVSGGTGVSGTSAVADFMPTGVTAIRFRSQFYGSTSTVSTTTEGVIGVVFANSLSTEATSGVNPFVANVAIMGANITNGTGTTTDATSFYIRGAPTGTATITNPVTAMWVASGISKFDGGLNFNPTNTAGGTTGNQTINKISGTVNIAATGATVTVTNSFVTTSSIVYCVIRTNDATATGIKNVVPGSGSFVVTLNAATTAEVSIGFFVIN